MEFVQLTETAAARDPEAVHEPRDRLEDLVRRHQAMVWRYLRLLGAAEDEADDLMQETFLRVSRGTAAGERLRAPAAFLRAVARNLLLGARRTARQRPPTVEWVDSVDALVARDLDAFTDLRIDALRDCCARLRGRGRQAVELHYIEGRSYRETAERLDLGLNGVKALLGRAREALRECVRQRMRGGLET